MVKKFIKENNYNKFIYYFKDDRDLKFLSKNDISFLNKNYKSRICTHSNKNSFLHEMFIFHQKGTIIKPHKHNVEESFLLLKGKVKLCIYNKKGINIHTSIIHSIFNKNSKNNFYYRIKKNVMHSQEFLEDTYFKESTLGPLNLKKTTYCKL
tara:strand:- start:7179 stop:7634 length:456 start_codon:yes stop_codon:yes gene_type:complete